MLMASILLRTIKLKSACALALLGLLASCQTTLNLMETDSKEHYLTIQDESNYCSEESPVEYSSDHAYLVDFAERELTPLYQKGSLSFDELVQAYILAHMMAAPDRYALSARFQYILSSSLKTQNRYQDIFAKDPLKSHASLLTGVRDLSPKTFYRVLSLVDRLMPKRIQVDDQLEEFLNRHKEELIKIKGVRAQFFKGELPIQEGESFVRVSADSLLAAYKKIDSGTNYYQTDYLFEAKDWSCSFDIGIYTNSIYLVRGEEKLQNGLLGVRAQKGKWFLASSVFNPAKIMRHPLLGSAWSTAEKTPPAAFCYTEKEQHTIALVSTKDRDPGQHLYHLLELGGEKLTSLPALKNYLDFTRYLILFSPERIVLESRRASSGQIENYLKLPAPIYHAEKLGKIWAYGTFNEGNPQRGFVVDGREEGHLSCSP